MYDVIVTVCPKSPESSECSVPEWRKCWLIEVHRPYSVSTLRLWCAHSISIHLTSLSNVEVACGGEAAGHVQRAGGEGRTTRNEMKVATATERGSMAGAGPVDRWRCSGQFRFRSAAVPYCSLPRTSTIGQLDGARRGRAQRRSARLHATPTNVVAVEKGGLRSINPDASAVCWCASLPSTAILPHRRRSECGISDAWEKGSRIVRNVECDSRSTYRCTECRLGDCRSQCRSGVRLGNRRCGTTGRTRTSEVPPWRGSAEPWASPWSELQ
jgi:hypothetical protein